ncbi:TolC family protein [Marinobacterium jannaschii]|uniref:TolC family protein n=1 Tax=Marinobacterium jannaschii TaxID=64970 RepID=UPI000487B47C|nr:TolC family protein [Marinobacterium jannaschii]
MSVTAPLALIILSALLSACATSRPAGPTPIPPPIRWQVSAQTAAFEQQLQVIIPSAALSDLIARVQRNNLDLQQTALLLKEQQSRVRQTEADRQPQLDLNVSSQRDGAEQTRNQYSLGLQLSWELDLWQRLADQSDAARAEYRARQFEFDAARNSLAARTASLWLDMAYAQQIIATEQARIASLSRSQAAIKERFLGGGGQLDDLEAASSARARAEAVLLQLQQTQAERLRELKLLLASTTPQPFILPAKLPQIEAVPVAIPAAVIAHRADIRAALERAYAADSNVAAAAKALLPRFSFSANSGYNSDQLDQLLSGSPVWQLLLNLSAPLLDGGRRQAEHQISQYSARRAWLSYRKTLLNALTEVNNSLQREQSLLLQIERQQVAVHHADNSRSYYRERYLAGQADILDLLRAQRDLFDSRINLLQSRQQHQKNRITLALALGMGV